jgi:hypothetical protein
LRWENVCANDLWRPSGRSHPGPGCAANQFEEVGDGTFHGFRLGIEFFGGSRAFLRVSRRGLRHFVHLAYGGIDLTDPLSLFPGSARHRGSQFIHLSRFGDNFVQGFCDLLANGGTL